MNGSGSAVPLRDALARTLDPYGTIILAVSGGADSTALLHVTADWVADFPHRRDTIVVATVDHQLRPGSGAEAAAVGRVARGLGFRHETLAWTGAKPGTGIQAAAREARYSLLAALAADQPAPPVAIVTAHTADDQAETLLMRLARGSGLDGLAAMPEIQTAFCGDRRFDLVRPLLSVTRADLIEYLHQKEVGWIDDPSNGDLRFERVRLRSVWPVLQGAGLGAGPLSLSSRRLLRARQALDEVTSGLASACVAVHGGAYAVIDVPRFQSAPEDLRVRLMSRVLSAFGGCAPPARLAEVEALVTRLDADPSLRATLGGCVLRSCRKEVRVFRETGRNGLPDEPLRRDETLTWDKRFDVSLTMDAGRDAVDFQGDSALRVRALSPIEAALLRRRDGPRLPARALVTLPSIWRGDVLVAVGGTGCAGDTAEGGSARPLGVEVRWLGDNAIFGAQAAGRMP